MPGQDNTINGPGSARRMEELAALTMPSDPTKVQQSIEEHEPVDCPFTTLEKQDGAMVPFHGAPCRWAMVVRERWHENETIRLGKAVDALGDRLRTLQSERE